MDCFQAYISRRTLDSDNEWKCDKCKNYVRPRKRTIFWKTSDILVILLKRYTVRHKIDTYLSYPDILDMKEVEGINFYKLDLYSDEFNKKIENYSNSVDLILSDMSVNLSGIKIVDEEGNKDLNLFCLELSKKILKPDGALLIKSFNNSNLLYLKKEFEKLFTNVYIEKPLASKTSSPEVYLLGLILK